MYESVIIKHNKVTFMATSVFTNKVEMRSFTERYAILLRDRWSVLYFFIKRYAIDNGQKGCYIGAKKGRDGCYYDIWDLSKIFPRVSFKENDYLNFLSC